MKNLICPNQLIVKGNVVDSNYLTSGSLKLIGNISSASNINLFSSQFVEIQTLSLIDTGSLFEVKIGGCGSN